MIPSRTPPPSRAAAFIRPVSFHRRLAFDGRTGGTAWIRGTGPHKVKVLPPCVVFRCRGLPSASPHLPIAARWAPSSPPRRGGEEMSTGVGAAKFPIEYDPIVGACCLL